MILNVCEVQRRTQAYKMNIFNHSFQKFQSQFFVHPLSYLRPAAELTSSVLEISGQTRKDTKEPIHIYIYVCMGQLYIFWLICMIKSVDETRFIPPLYKI